MMHPESTTPLMLSNEADLGGVLDLALDRVRAGQRQVLIQVTDADLERRLEARLDMAQARESIDATQRQAIQVGRPVNLLTAAEPTGLTDEEVEAAITPKEPTSVMASEDDLALDVDVDAFVNGDIPEEALDAPILGGLAGTAVSPPDGSSDRPPTVMEEIAAEEDQRAVDAVDATLAAANEEDDTDDEEENLDEPPE
jgi:hypothetical protein